MELFEVLNNFCNRNSGAVSKDDKRKHSFILKRLFSAEYPIQCELINRLDTDPVCASNIIALIATQFNGIPQFLKTRVDQTKKKSSITKNFEDCILHKYMEVNQCGIREVEEAYQIAPKEIEKAMKLIKSNFFINDKEKLIIDKINNSKQEEEDISNELF